MPNDTEQKLDKLVKLYKKVRDKAGNASRDELSKDETEMLDLLVDLAGQALLDIHSIAVSLESMADSQAKIVEAQGLK